MSRTSSQLPTGPHPDTAVVVHDYYPELWPLLAERLSAFGEVSFDLLVSVPPGRREGTREDIGTALGRASVHEVTNRGRDVAPFLAFAAALDRAAYRYVLKLHTKKSPHRPAGHGWLEQILTSLLPADAELHTRLFEILGRPDTGLVGPKGQYLTLPVNYAANRRHLMTILTRACSAQEARRVDEHRWAYGFFAGTMFWARLDALRPLLRHPFHTRDFEPERRQIDGTLAHAMERALSVVPEVKGRSMHEISPSGIERVAYDAGDIPEWSDLHAQRKLSGTHAHAATGPGAASGS